MSDNHAAPRWLSLVALAVLTLVGTGIYLGVEWAMEAWGGR